MSTAEPIRWDRTIYRHTDHVWTLRRLDDDGNPVIPEYAHFQVRQRFGGEVWIDGVSVSTQNSRIEIDPVEGWLKLIIPEDETALDEWDLRTTGVWDVVVHVGDTVTRWAQGNVEVSQSVTR